MEEVEKECAFQRKTGRIKIIFSLQGFNLLYAHCPHGVYNSTITDSSGNKLRARIVLIHFHTGLHLTAYSVVYVRLPTRELLLTFDH